LKYNSKIIWIKLVAAMVGGVGGGGSGGGKRP